MATTNSEHHSFSVSLAAQYGVYEAILIHHFQYWINHNKRLDKNYKDGRTWTYQTRKDIAAWFPYMTEDQVRRLTDRLVELKVLRKGCYNKISIDKTIWYAFENEEMFTNGKFASRVGKSASRVGKSAKAIPDTKTNTKTDANKNNIGTADKESASPANKREFFFDRDKNIFVGKEKLMPSLKEAFPSLDIPSEIAKMELWLTSNPKGKRRKGTEKFVFDWLNRATEQKEYNEKNRSNNQWNNSQSQKKCNKTSSAKGLQVRTSQDVVCLGDYL